MGASSVTSARASARSASTDSLDSWPFTPATIQVVIVVVSLLVATGGAVFSVGIVASRQASRASAALDATRLRNVRHLMGDILRAWWRAVHAARCHPGWWWPTQPVRNARPRAGRHPARNDGVLVPRGRHRLGVHRTLH